jgi:N-acetyl-anhydromuramyl-L-alanine amidase AmpD
MPRDVWALESPINHRLTPMGRVRRITVHHEGAVTPNDHTGIVEVAADIRDIRKVHLRVLGAGDIGYHYVIDRAGRIWTGRPAAYRGAHAGGDANIGNLGIMLLGNFDIQTPTDRQKLALLAFLHNQMKRYVVPVRAVFTHQELKPTRCPGKSLQKYMNRLRAGLHPGPG